MLNKQGKSNTVNSNGGFSLIEAIVSLLIMAIIVIPLLNMFVFSARTNAKSAEQQMATSVATSVVEEINEKGISKWAKEKNWDLSTETIQFDESRGDFEFAVEVSCEAISRKTSPESEIKWNEYEMADISKLSRKTTAIIDPFELFVAYEGTGNNKKVKLIDTYDDMAATEFRNKHLEEIYNHWSAYVSRLEEDEEQPPAPKACSIDSIKKKMARELIVSISNDSENTQDGRVVSAIIKYTLDCDLEYHYGTNLTELNAYVPSKNQCREAHERAYDGFYDKIKFDELRDIYLFHTPLRGSMGAWSGNKEGKNDKITLVDNTGIDGKNRRLFIAPQLYDLIMGIPCDVSISSNNPWEIYCLSDDAKFADKNKYLLEGKTKIPAYEQKNHTDKNENQLTEKLTAENRLYKIEVTVSRKSDGKELITLNLEDN